MKARLVIGAAVCAAMLAILASVTTPAKADNPGGLTCNGSVTNADASVNSQVWHVNDTHHCNNGKTYSWEIQYNTDAHPLQWHDWGQGDHVRTSSDCTNGCDASYQDASSGCASSGSIYQFRVQWWWGDGSVKTFAAGAQSVCNGSILLTTP